MKEYEKKIYEVVKKIPKGEILTYGQVAKISGVNCAQLVGQVLHRNPDPENIPCHRVVNARGEVAKNYAFGGGEAQTKKLQAEGVIVSSK